MELTPCHRCRGSDPECPLCKGTNIWQIFRCPLSMLTPDIQRMLGAYRWYQNGILPDPGAMLDQAATFVEAVIVIENELGEIQAEEVRRMKEKANG
jgi:hypothetical protein